MPPPIAIGRINTIIVRCQTSHKTSPSNTTRKAVAISLEAIRRPHWQTQQGHVWGCCGYHNDTHPMLTIVVTRAPITATCVQWTLLQHFANQRRSHGSYAWCNNGNYLHHQHGCKQHKLHNSGSHGGNKRNNKKSLPECKDKGFKPCCLHGAPITCTTSATLAGTIKRTPSCAQTSKQQ